MNNNKNYKKNLKNSNNKQRKNVSHSNRRPKAAKISADGSYVENNGNRIEPIVSLPEIVQNPVRQVYRRFITASAVSGTIRIYDLLNQFLVATSSTTAYSVVSAVRIKKIRALAPITSQGTSTTLSIKPKGQEVSDNNFNSVPQQFTDTSTSIDVPAYISLSPSIETPFGSWHLNKNVDGDLFTINCPGGTTLDILFEYVDRNPSEGPLVPLYVRTSSTMSAGVCYCTPLGSATFIPVGVNYAP